MKKLITTNLEERRKATTNLTNQLEQRQVVEVRVRERTEGTSSRWFVVKNKKRGA